MRRDSIFYQLFQQSPTLLFELLSKTPENAASYRFESVAVKEPKFEIDGVFLPPENYGAGIVYFCEVQFQKDERLYERLFAESILYFYRNRERFRDWQVVVIYPSRSIEQSDTYPHRAFLNSDQVYRIYLDELGDIRQLPLGLALMVLTTVKETQAPEEARYVLTRVQQEVTEPALSRAIIEMLTKIMVYKFDNLSKAEVEAMMGIRLQETRVYREAKAEGRQEEASNLIIRQLKRRFGKELSDETKMRISSLPLSALEDLSEVLLDFINFTDFQTWLDAQN